MDKFLSRVDKVTRSSSPVSSVASVNAAVVCACSSTESDRTPTKQDKPQKRKKGISRVWKYFKRSDDKKFAKCLNCGKEYKTSGNTSNLKDHLKRFHPGLDAPSPDASMETNTTDSNPSGLSASTSSSCRSSTHSISSYFKRAILYDNSSRRKKEIDRELTIMIALDVQPFNIVENEGFVRYSQILDPRYKMPSKTFVRDVLMKNMFLESVAELQLIIKAAHHVAITCDGWTSSANESYLTVTAHFVYKYTLQSASLETRKLNDTTNHSAKNIAETLKDVLTKWNVFDKTLCIVTDNASSMLKACELLQIKNLPCFAHTLNLVVQDGLKVEKESIALKNVFEKSKAIVRFFKKSSISMEKLRIAQDNETPYSLLQEVPTRWNSFYIMIERILLTKDAISKVLLATSNAPLPFNVDEINILKDVKQILEIFQNATDKISGGKYVTVSLIIPMVYGLCRKVELSLKELITIEGKLFGNAVFNSIKTRLFTYEQRTITRMATIIDPRFKKHGFQSTFNADQASVCLENELVNITHLKPTHDQDTGAKQNEEPTFFDFLQEKAKQSTHTARSDAIRKKGQYLERSIATEETDPLLWIKVNENEFDLIKILIFKYLCVPATSVESERMFSKAGQIISDRRTRLKEKNINMLLFLNKNSWLIKK